MTEAGAGPLGGIRVLDLTRYVSGPYCTLLLAQMGAEVVKVEMPPRGDDYRVTGPQFLDGEGTVFLSLNAGKRSLALDFRQPEGRRALRRMLARVDVVVENARPGNFARYGLDYAAARKINSKLVYCSISGFGQTGPRRQEGGFDLVVQGLGGLMSVTGEEEGAPTKVGLPVLDMGAAMFAVQGILGALLARERTGAGQYVETSLFDCALAWQCAGITTYFAAGTVPGRHGSASPYFAPYQAFRTQDGYITVAGAPSQDLWARFCRAIGGAHLIDEPSFKTNADRVANRQALAGRIEDILVTRTSEEWLDRLSAEGVPAGPIQTLDGVLQDPQVGARELVVKLPRAAGDAVHCIGSPVKLSETPWRTESAPPRLGEHGPEVLASFGFTEAEIAELRAKEILVVPDEKSAA